MISSVKAYSLIGFGVVSELPCAAALLVLLNLLPYRDAKNASGS
jgi:hypothetical protein